MIISNDKNRTDFIVLRDAPPSERVIEIRGSGGVLVTTGFRPGAPSAGAAGSAGPSGAVESASAFAEASVEEARFEKALLSERDMGLKDMRFSDYAQQGPPPEAEAPVAEIGGVEELLIGADDRIRVPEPTEWPYSVHGHMVMRFPNGKLGIGSGALVNRRHVLTAGHTVFSRANGGWATSVRFNAAQNDHHVPFGTAWASRLLSVRGWTDGGESEWDYALMVLDRDVGDEAGWLGMVAFEVSDRLLRRRVNVSGYPGDKAGGSQLWTHEDVIKSVAGEKLYYDIDTIGGQSGSGVWTPVEGFDGDKIVGVHTTGDPTGNSATRISRAKFDNIIGWFQDW